MTEAEPDAAPEPGAGSRADPGRGTEAGASAEPATASVTEPAAESAAEPTPAPALPAPGRLPSLAGSLALVAAGGCAGTLVRAALEHARPATPGHLPTTTLAINVVGALVLGLLLGSLGEQRPRLRLALGTGVLGGLTTHSTFILESHRLLASGGAAGRPALGAAYLLGSMAAGLAAAAVGLWLAGRLRRRDRQGGSALQEAS